MQAGGASPNKRLFATYGLVPPLAAGACILATGAGLADSWPSGAGIWGIPVEFARDQMGAHNGPLSDRGAIPGRGSGLSVA